MVKARKYFALALCSAFLAASCGGSSTTTVHVPAQYASQFAKGADNGKYVYYALANKIPAWSAIAKTGLFICSTSRPSLIPQDLLGSLSSLPSGTLATLNGSDVKKSLGVDHLLVTVPAAINGCTEAALKEMKTNPGTILMVDASAKFAEQSQLANVTLTP